MDSEPSEGRGYKSACGVQANEMALPKGQRPDQGERVPPLDREASRRMLYPKILMPGSFRLRCLTGASSFRLIPRPRIDVCWSGGWMGAKGGLAGRPSPIMRHGLR